MAQEITLPSLSAGMEDAVIAKWLVVAGEQVVRGQIVLANVMTVTLSVDHRSVDGVLGARVLSAFKAGIEEPFSLLV